MPLRLLTLLLLVPLSALAYRRAGRVLTTDGSWNDVRAAIAAAASGSIVQIPAGHFTWRQSAAVLSMRRRIAVAGAGTQKTFIDLYPYRRGAGLFNVVAPCVIKDFSITSHDSSLIFAIRASATPWQISGVAYRPLRPGGYFCIISGAFGLIDHCDLAGANGEDELIFIRGPANSWQTPNSLGGPDNVFIEDCTFHGPGYVCDANSNSRVVVRFCRIDGPMKIDAHGAASDTPPRGVRHVEIYDNTWTTHHRFVPLIEVRGGSGYIFDNRTLNTTPTTGWFFLVEYGALSRWRNFHGRYQTPADYPVRDQIGVGRDPKRAASAPMYLWNNRCARALDAGAATADWALRWKQIPGAALAQFRRESGNPAARYTLQDLIRVNRDYFVQPSGAPFDGRSGVGTGTAADMAALHPAQAGVGFWVTDQGHWNRRMAAPSGELYVWTGLKWVLHYVPYAYPYPGVN